MVTQLVSGRVVAYSCALKKGDFISVNGVQGVVGRSRRTGRRTVRP